MHPTMKDEHKNEERRGYIHHFLSVKPRYEQLFAFFFGACVDIFPRRRQQYWLHYRPEENLHNLIGVDGGHDHCCI